MSWYIWILIIWCALAIIVFAIKEISEYFGLTFAEVVHYIIIFPLLIILFIFCIIACPFVYVYKKSKGNKEKEE